LALAVPTLDPLLAIDPARFLSRRPPTPSLLGAEQRRVRRRCRRFHRGRAATAAPADSVREKPRNMFGMFLERRLVQSSSRPTRMNVETVLWTAGVAAGTALLMAYDEDVLDFMRDQGDRPVYGALLDVASSSNRSATWATRTSTTPPRSHSAGRSR
jgi:hypothetical protein